MKSKNGAYLKKSIDTTNKNALKTREVKIKTFQLMRGFKDILPSGEGPHWSHLRAQADAVAQKYSFQRIDLPLLEVTQLFKKSLGDSNEVLENELFSFVTAQGNDHLTLRPDFTPSIVRAYIEHNLASLPQPTKFYYRGPVFRYGRSQAGRYRQFHQIGFELIGEENAASDGEILLMAYNLFRKIGLDVNVEINSIGCAACRTEYKKELAGFYKTKKGQLCKECQRKLFRNPMRLFECKEIGCVSIKGDAPQIVDWLCEDCQKHFMRVLEYLDELSIPYLLNSTLVRSLDYYSRTIFEIYTVEEQEQEKDLRIALAGGGRYDTLIEQLGGKATGATGIAIGMERVVTKMREKEISVPEVCVPSILLAHIGETAKMKAIRLFEKLYDEGFPITENFVRDSLKNQLELADRLKCRYVLILGQKEVIDNTILIRDMEGGIQEVIDVNKVGVELRRKLENRSS